MKNIPLLLPGLLIVPSQSFILSPITSLWPSVKSMITGDSWGDTFGIIADVLAVIIMVIILVLESMYNNDNIGNNNTDLDIVYNINSNEIMNLSIYEKT